MRAWQGGIDFPCNMPGKVRRRKAFAGTIPLIRFSGDTISNPSQPRIKRRGVRRPRRAASLLQAKSHDVGMSSSEPSWPRLTPASPLGHGVCGAQNCRSSAPSNSAADPLWRSGRARHRPEEAFPAFWGLSGRPAWRSLSAPSLLHSSVLGSWDVARVGKIASARGTHTPIAYHDDIRGWRGTPRALAMLLPVVWHWQLQTERAKSSVALQVLWARRSKRPRSGIFRVPTTASSLLPELDVFAINGYIQPRANGRQPAPSGRRTPSSGQTGLSDVGFPG